MTLKLFKYEMDILGRKLGLIFGAAAVLAAVTSIMSLIFDTFADISIIFHILINIGVSAAVVIIIVQRYYAATAGDEGYLINTLPAKASEIAASRILSGTVWTFLYGLFGLAYAAVFMLLINTDGSVSALFKSLFDELSALSAEYGSEIQLLKDYSFAIAAEMIILIVLSVISQQLQFYLAILLGQEAADSHKKAASFGMYIAVNMAVSTVSKIVMAVISGFFSLGMKFDTFEQTISNAVVMFAAVCAVTAAMCAAMFAVSCVMLGKKLNMS